MNNQKIAGIPGLIGLLMIVSTHSWAKPCTKMIETVQGTEMYMPCHYLKIIAVILGIGLMAISVEGIIKKKVCYDRQTFFFTMQTEHQSHSFAKMRGTLRSAARSPPGPWVGPARSDGPAPGRRQGSSGHGHSNCPDL